MIIAHPEPGITIYDYLGGEESYYAAEIDGIPGDQYDIRGRDLLDVIKRARETRLRWLSGVQKEKPMKTRQQLIAEIKKLRDEITQYFNDACRLNKTRKGEDFINPDPGGGASPGMCCH